MAGQIHWDTGMKVQRYRRKLFLWLARLRASHYHIEKVVCENACLAAFSWNVVNSEIVTAFGDPALVAECHMVFGTSVVRCRICRVRFGQYIYLFCQFIHEFTFFKKKASNYSIAHCYFSLIFFYWCILNFCLCSSVYLHSLHSPDSSNNTQFGALK